MRRATLVLSGGGAKGNFQVACERVLREEQGYEWDRIFGVSVGALNAAFLGQGEYMRLSQLWAGIHAEDVYQHFGWPRVAWRVLHGKTGLYDNGRLRNLINREVGAGKFKVPVHVGRVSLTTGKYELVESSSPEFFEAVFQSATMPVIWEAVGPHAYVDGGIRNISPLGAVFDFDPAEVVVINCGIAGVEETERPHSVLDAARRALTDIALDEVFCGDVEGALRINRLVRQAQEVGLTLRREDGRPYRYFPIRVIEPVVPLGHVLDFSRAALRHAAEQGMVAARGPAMVTLLQPEREARFA